MMLMNEEELREYGKRLGAGLGPGSVVALTGELGAGKTTFAQAVAAGLGVTETVTSPTFTLICEYESGRLPFYHFDVYRLPEEGEEALGGDTAAEMVELGFETYFYSGGVTVVEWADRVASLLPEDALWVDIAYTDDPDLREVRCLNETDDGPLVGALPAGAERGEEESPVGARTADVKRGETV